MEWPHCAFERVVFLPEGFQSPQTVFLKLEVLRRSLVSKTIAIELVIFLRSLVSFQYVAEVPAHWRHSADYHCGYTESQEGLVSDDSATKQHDVVRNRPRWFASIMLLLMRMQHYQAWWLVRGNSRCSYNNATDRANCLPSSSSEPSYRCVLCAECFGADRDEQRRNSGFRSSGGQRSTKEGLRAAENVFSWMANTQCLHQGSVFISCRFHNIRSGNGRLGQ